MRTLLIANGLAPHLLTILDDSPAAAQAAIEAGVDKVILTGSAQTGRAVLHSLADHLTPSVMELSGCDAVFVLDGADLDRVIDAIVFGLRFNGSATCMAPRRLIVSEPVAAELIPRLKNALCNFEPRPATKSARALIGELIEEAVLFGANVQLNGLGDSPRLGPTLIAVGAPSMRIAQADIFAPILTVLAATSEDDALHLHRQCPYALTAAVFGPAHAAQQFATRVHAGTVLVNDVIVSSADPRISFGGRGKSGFGVTRGAEGLLEMTVVKNIVIQINRSRRAFQSTTIAHTDFFVALLRLLHGGRWAAKYAALLDLIRSARTLKP
jgi:aldehyde dehydrogenase (NAD+)